MVVIWQMLSELGNVILYKNLEAWPKTFIAMFYSERFCSREEDSRYTLGCLVETNLFHCARSLINDILRVRCRINRGQVEVT